MLNVQALKPMKMLILKQFTNCSQKEGRELARELKESYSSILLSIDNQIHKIQHLEKELYNNRARLDYLMKVSINTTPLDVQILNHIYVQLFNEMTLNQVKLESLKKEAMLIQKSLNILNLIEKE